MPSTDPLSGFWYGAVAPRTLAGVDVNESVAMTYSACWAATRLLSGTAGYLPLNLRRERKSGGSDLADGESLFSILHDSPNPEMSSMMWRATKVNQQVNRGNCISEIERDGHGNVFHLWPIHASRVKLCVHRQGEPDAGKLYYDIRNDDGTHTELDYEDVFHVPSWMSDDGRWGKGVIQAARESIGHAIATERFGASWFGNGARPSAVLKHPGKLNDEARANLRREWNEIYQGPDNSNKTAVLWEGMDLQVFAESPEHSQFIQSRQHSIEEIARWYGCPPHLIGHLLRSTFNNIEHTGIEFVKYSLLPWLKMWEQEIWRKLLTKSQRSQGFYAKFSVDALERGDITSRTAALAQQFFNGAITLNQWAELEDRNPIGPDGDVHFVQSAMIPLEQAVKGPQQPEPPAIPDTPAKDDEPANEPDPQQMSIHAAAVDVLGDIVGIMLDKEAKAALSAAKNPAQFLAWLESFYTEHESRMLKALAKPIRACVLASRQPLIVDDTLREAVRSHVAASKAALLTAASGPPDGFVGAVEACVTKWERTEIVELLRGDTKCQKAA
jgi:HK97 family phage portal protein